MSIESFTVVVIVLLLLSSLGGSTLFKGFGDRLLSEVKKLAPKDIKIRISAPQERLYSTWIGGSILASLDTFKKMWVSKREYDEEGHRAIHRKTFWTNERTNKMFLIFDKNYNYWFSQSGESGCYNLVCFLLSQLALKWCRSFQNESLLKMKKKIWQKWNFITPVSGTCLFNTIKY